MFTDYTTYSELKLLVEITHFKLPRPAPPCSNPDSPLFSDPGDDGELEFDIFVVIKDGEDEKEIPLPDSLDFIYDEIYEEVSNYCEESYADILQGKEIDDYEINK